MIFDDIAWLEDAGVEEMERQLPDQVTLRPPILDYAAVRRPGLSLSVMNPDWPTAHYLLSRFLVDGRIAGFYPVSFVFQEYKGLDTFEQWCRLERRMGFSSKGCISPDQPRVLSQSRRDQAGHGHCALFRGGGGERQYWLRPPDYCVGFWQW
jgi:hypothetical protein